MPLLISTIVFVTMIALLWVGKLGEVSFTFLVAATALFGLVLHGFGRLKELDLKNLRVVLREIKVVKEEIFVREEKLKSIVTTLVHVLAYSGAVEGRWSDSESSSLKRQWYRKKLNILIETLGLSAEERAEAKKFMEKYEEIDKLFAGRGALNTTDTDYADVKAKIELVSEQIREMLRKDISL